MSAVIKADKEKTLGKQNKNELQELQQNAEAALSRKQQEMIAPINGQNPNCYRCGS